MCKLALCGLSPLELLRSTKSIHDVYRVLGPEYRLRAPDAAERAEWAGLSQRDRDAYGYEYDLRQVLERLVAECDRRIARGHERVEREAQALPWTAEEEAEREDLERREEEALVLAQALGEARCPRRPGSRKRRRAATGCSARASSRSAYALRSHYECAYAQYYYYYHH